MRYEETCCCGARVMFTGWGIREVDVSHWWQRHRACGRTIQHRPVVRPEHAAKIAAVLREAAKHPERYQ